MKHQRHHSGTEYLLSFLAVLLLTALLQAPALAEDSFIPEGDQTVLVEAEAPEETALVAEDPLPEPEIIVVPDDYVPEGEVLEFAPPMLAAEDSDSSEYELALLQQLSTAVREALLNGISEISLQNVTVTRTTAKQFTAAALVYACPYYDGSHIGASLKSSASGKYRALILRNDLSAEETKAWVDRVDEKLGELLALIDDDSLSSADQALILHDYMASHYYYSKGCYYPGVILTENKGVCQSYAYLFQYVMNQKSLQCYCVASTDMNHIWNVLKIGDQYYHIDVTRDDVVEDRYGLAQHKDFLKTDATMQDENHGYYNWTPTDYVCDDASYEDDYFTDSSSPVVFDGTKRYYVNLETYELKCYDTADGTETAIRPLGLWPAGDQQGAAYKYCYSGLWKDHGRIFFNTWYAVMSYDPASGTFTTWAAPDLGDGYLYGSMLEDGVIRYAQDVNPQVPYTEKNIVSVGYTPIHVWAEDCTTDLEPTCTEPGSTSRHCQYCEAGTDVTEIPALGHTYVPEVVAPTILARGYTRYTCSVCGDSYIDEASYTDRLEAPDGWNQVDGRWYYFKGNVLQTGWLKLNEKWYYLDPATGAMRTGWCRVDGKWYYLSTGGAMQTGWQWIRGKWYYLKNSMQTGWQQIDGSWYYLDPEDGYMLTGWQQVDGKWYYLDNAMQTGWLKLNEKWYYLDNAMVTGWKQLRGSWYYFSDKGAMQTGWQQVDEKWYYLSTDGVMQTGWQQVDEKWYYLSTGGAMQTGWQYISGSWYYLNNEMKTGWQQISGTWYYFRTNGTMVSGCTLKLSGRYYTFSSSGAWVR